MMQLKKQGFDITVEDQDDYLFINLDKNGKHGGYISVKFDDDGIVLDMFNADGDVISSTWSNYNEVEPTEKETTAC